LQRGDPKNSLQEERTLFRVLSFIASLQMSRRFHAVTYISIVRHENAASDAILNGLLFSELFFVTTGVVRRPSGFCCVNAGNMLP
jgi:hypothetical protein